MAAFLASFFGAALSALGMGGGGILLMYLSAYEGMDQLTAQGINLLFFFPVAAVALVLHAKNKLISWKIVWPCVLLGVPGVLGGALLAQFLGSEMLRRLFGGFLLVIGVRELLVKDTSTKGTAEKN